MRAVGVRKLFEMASFVKCPFAGFCDVKPATTGMSCVCGLTLIISGVAMSMLLQLPESVVSVASSKAGTEQHPLAWAIAFASFTWFMARSSQWAQPSPQPQIPFRAKDAKRFKHTRTTSSDLNPFCAFFKNMSELKFIKVTNKSLK